jgi:hypothetical protein
MVAPAAVASAPVLEEAAACCAPALPVPPGGGAVGACDAA